jgi:hypothetical protein
LAAKVFFGAVGAPPPATGAAAMDSRGSKINVVVRLRPLNEKEQVDGEPLAALTRTPRRRCRPSAAPSLSRAGSAPRLRAGVTTTCSPPLVRAGTLPVVTSSTQNKEVTIIRGTGKAQVRSTFKYDGVFGSYATQAEVFDGVLAGPHSVLSDVMKGHESTVFAYGQTGTGKTHTMEGDLTNSSTMGVRPHRHPPPAAPPAAAVPC